MSPCDWPVNYGPGCPLIQTLTPEQRASIEAAAVELLWNFTGRRFGVCAVLLRPCTVAPPTKESDFQRSGWRLQPALIDGVWMNLDCGCSHTCQCSVDGPTSLRLPGPVNTITEILIDGVVLPPTSYRLDYRTILIRTDGGYWPVQQDMLLAATEPGTFQIKYGKGTPVPPGGQLAAGRLACEMAKAYTNDNTCKLPQRVQTITRQGVTVGFVDIFDGLELGRTGIWEIDSWVASVNYSTPYAGVRSVDIHVAP